MKQFIKSLFLSGLLVSLVMVSFADRGIRKKSKNRVMLNIPVNPKKKNLLFQIGDGLTYKGSLLLNETRTNGSIITSSLVTYQKDNVIYIQPYKQKILVPESGAGYSGMKLIIKTR